MAIPESWMVSGWKIPLQQMTWEYPLLGNLQITPEVELGLCSSSYLCYETNRYGQQILMLYAYNWMKQGLNDI